MVVVPGLRVPRRASCWVALTGRAVGARGNGDGMWEGRRKEGGGEGEERRTGVMEGGKRGG